LLFQSANSLQYIRIELFIKIAESFIHARHSADKLKITFSADGEAAGDAIGLTEWVGTGVLRGAKTIAAGKGTETYNLGMGLDGG
jgi:hypothetical protein